MLVKIRGLSRCVFWAWCRGYMVALTSMSLRGLLTTFISTYLPLELPWELLATMVVACWRRPPRVNIWNQKLEARLHTCAAAGRAAVKAEELKREASGALLQWKLGRGPGSLKACCCGLRPAEECVWLVERKSAVVTKPGDWRPFLVKINKNRRSWGRQIDRRLRKIPSMGLVVWTEMLGLWCNGKWCHRMLLNRQLDGGKTAVFMSEGWLLRLCTTWAN